MSPRYPALRNRNFLLLWLGLLLSNVGTWMQNVARSWLIYKLGGDDPLYLGLLGLSFALPMVTLPPLGGAVADRVDRVKLLYFTESAALLLAVILALLAWTSTVRPWHLLATTFVGAVLLAFDNPARQALMAEIVPRDALPNAIALNTSTFTGAALVGPALAGLLFDVIGAGWIFMVNALSFLFVLAALVALRAPPRPSPPTTSWSEAFLGGFTYAREHRRACVVLLLSAIAALLGRSYPQILPVFASRWHGGSSSYGALLAGAGAGAFAGALGLSSFRRVPAPTRAFGASGLLLAMALAAFALMPTRIGGVTLLVVVGLAATIFTTTGATILQLDVPGELRGRVMGLFTITVIGLPALGAFGIAALARLVGAPFAVSVGAGLLLLIFLLAAPWRTLICRRP